MSDIYERLKERYTELTGLEPDEETMMQRAALLVSMLQATYEALWGNRG